MHSFTQYTHNQFTSDSFSQSFIRLAPLPFLQSSIRSLLIYFSFHWVTQHFTQIHSFNHSPLLSLAHSLISSFPLACFPYRWLKLRRRLDVFLTSYLDKGSRTELAEVGLEAMQYPGRVWPGKTWPNWSRALRLYTRRITKLFRTWRSSVWSLHQVGYSSMGM